MLVTRATFFHAVNRRDHLVRRAFALARGMFFIVAKSLSDLHSQVVINGKICVLCGLDKPVRGLLLLVVSVQGRLDLLRGLDQRLQLRQLNVLNGVGLEFVFGGPGDQPPDGLEGLLIVWGKEREDLALATDTSRSTASVDVNFSVEGRLVVEHSLDVGDIEPASGYVCAHKDRAIASGGACLAG